MEMTKHTNRMAPQRLLTRVSLCLAVLILLLSPNARAQYDSPCNQGRTNTDPRSPYLVCIPELGVQYGPDGTTAEGFGDQIVPLGRLGHDSLPSWIIGRTYVPEGGNAHELLVYRGVAGGLPDRHSGIRLGPTERASSTTAIAVGDWDSDGNVDIATRIELFHDSTAGTNGHYQIARLVIWWGHDDGHFSLSDTTQLECDAQMWLGLYAAVHSMPVRIRLMISA